MEAQECLRLGLSRPAVGVHLPTLGCHTVAYPDRLDVVKGEIGASASADVAWSLSEARDVALAQAGSGACGP